MPYVYTDPTLSRYGQNIRILRLNEYIRIQVRVDVTNEFISVFMQIYSKYEIQYSFRSEKHIQQALHHQGLSPPSWKFCLPPKIMKSFEQSTVSKFLFWSQKFHEISMIRFSHFWRCQLTKFQFSWKNHCSVFLVKELTQSKHEESLGRLKRLLSQQLLKCFTTTSTTFDCPENFTFV